MATTYEVAFELSFKNFKLKTLKKYNDGVRADLPYSCDFGKKITGINVKSSAPDSQVGGASLGVGTVFDVPAAGTLALDLQAVTDIAERTAQSFGHYKALVFALLNVLQGGSAATQVTIGNSGTGAHQLFLGADAQAFVLKGGQWLVFGDTNAAGTVVDGTNHNVLVTNNDGAVIGKLLVGIIGGA